MKVYLATPATQLHAEMMAGCDVLESFALKATAPWMVRYRPTFRSMMLDSGAFSEMTSGKPVDLGAYVAYAVEHGAAYDEIVNLDVISGDIAKRVDASTRNLQTMRDAGIDALPVFHQGEPWSVLEELAACGKVGLGLQRPIRSADDFLNGCFERLDGVCVHGFAMANERYTGRFPFASVDSATWIHELMALSALNGQGSDVLRYQTQGELLRLVITKYQRLPMASAWAGSTQGSLFERAEPETAP
jgi:hypothetical protein